MSGPGGLKLIFSRKMCPSHPSRPVHARGGCRSCYDGWLKANNPDYAARQRDNNKRWLAANRERDKETRRQYMRRRGNRLQLLRKYGMTPSDYDLMLESQGGACAICRKPPKPGTRLHVDHCHETGRVRGLLCFRCNFGLSFFHDDPETLARASSHVASPSSEAVSA